MNLSTRAIDLLNELHKEVLDYADYLILIEALQKLEDFEELENSLERVKEVVKDFPKPTRRIIVYGAIQTEANRFLQKLKTKFIKDNILKESYSKYVPSNITLTNGDVYISVGANESSRGQKWDYAYIDEKIPLGVFHNVILPSGLSNSDYEFY